MKKLNLTLILLCTTLIYGCKSESNSTSRAIASTAELCGRYRWDESNLPLKLSVDRDLNNRFYNNVNSETISPGITNALSGWENAINRGSGTIFSSTLTILDNPTQHDNIALYRSDKDGASDILGIYASDNWMSNQSSQALAVTYYTIVVNNTTNLYRLTSADIIFNFRDHNFVYNSVFVPNFDNQNHRQYDLQTVLTHELGHFLGYCHVESSEYSSVMQPYYDGQNRDLKSGDTNYISNLYRTSNVSTSALKTKEVSSKHPDDEEIHFVVELMADGECNHYQEGKKTYSHKVDLSKKHNH